MFENVIPVTVSPPEYDSSNGFSAGDNDDLDTILVSMIWEIYKFSYFPESDSFNRFSVGDNK